MLIVTATIVIVKLGFFDDENGVYVSYKNGLNLTLRSYVLVQLLKPLLHKQVGI